MWLVDDLYFLTTFEFILDYYVLYLFCCRETKNYISRFGFIFKKNINACNTQNFQYCTDSEWIVILIQLNRMWRFKYKYRTFAITHTTTTHSAQNSHTPASLFTLSLSLMYTYMVDTGFLHSIMLSHIFLLDICVVVVLLLLFCLIFVAGSIFFLFSLRSSSTFPFFRLNCFHTGFASFSHLGCSLRLNAFP